TFGVRNRVERPINRKPLTGFDRLINAIIYKRATGGGGGLARRKRPPPRTRPGHCQTTFLELTGRNDPSTRPTTCNNLDTGGKQERRVLIRSSTRISN
ncbi:unnamed protein product, partial [Nesidiocoris tenuis]